MQLKWYSIETEGIKPICKSPGIWGFDKDSNGFYPLIYFQKPKWISDDSFQKIIKHLSLNLPADIEIKGE